MFLVEVTLIQEYASAGEDEVFDQHVEVLLTENLESCSILQTSFMTSSCGFEQPAACC